MQQAVVRYWQVGYKSFEESMNVLIDINHPAHVHLFRNVYAMLVEHGNKVLVVVKEIPSAMKLLDL